MRRELKEPVIFTSFKRWMIRRRSSPGRSSPRWPSSSADFIAYELAEGFRSRGLETIWLIRGPYFLRRILDEAGGELVDTIAREHGVTMVYGEEVKEVKATGGEVSAVVTSETGRRSTPIWSALALDSPSTRAFSTERALR